MKYFIGLDAHSSTSTFAVLNEIGECVLRKTVDTSEKNLWNVLDSLNGERHLTLEESTISQWLYLTLKEKVEKLIICNPTYVAKKQGAKTDFSDALHLANDDKKKAPDFSEAFFHLKMADYLILKSNNPVLHRIPKTLLIFFTFPSTKIPLSSTKNTSKKASQLPKLPRNFCPPKRPLGRA